MPPNQDNRYDFIMNPPKPTKQPMKFGNSLGARIAIVVGGLFFLIIAIGLASSFAGRAGQAQTDRLIAVAKAESELNRISTLADDKTTDIASRNLAATTGLSARSSLQQTKQLLAKRGTDEKAITKVLQSSANEKVDAALDTATKNNRFDEEFQKIIATQISDYQAKLRAAFENGTKSEQETLSRSFESSGRLIPKDPDAQEVSQAN